MRPGAMLQDFSDFSDTEQCLLEVVIEPRFTREEKAQLVRDYEPYISARATLALTDRIMLIEGLRGVFSK